MDYQVHQADFVTTAVDVAGCPKATLPEIAFVGRSNVGKSSLINALCQRKKLVRVSNTPGRTRALNFFDVKVHDGKRAHAVRFCDLPGYGYAKISKAEKAGWRDLIEGYLRGREHLAAVVQLVDAEIGPTDQDTEMLSWLQQAGRPIVPVGTKLDRLSKAKRIPALAAHERALGLPARAILGVSSTEPLGLDALWARLLELAER